MTYVVSDTDMTITVTCKMDVAGVPDFVDHGRTMRPRQVTVKYVQSPGYGRMSYSVSGTSIKKNREPGALPIEWNMYQIKGSPQGWLRDAVNDGMQAIYAHLEGAGIRIEKN